MIHIIFGGPGKGKSSLQACIAKSMFREHGRSIMRNCRAMIDSARADGHELFYPDHVPIFSDFPMRFKTGYEKYRETYFVNGYYLGLPNDSQPVMAVPPGSVIFLSEAQRYYDSRKSKTFPEWVSRFYEMHRHYGLEIYMDVQRPILVDANIRELCEDFIEIVELEHEHNFVGRIDGSVWHCRRWTEWKRVEQYQNTGEKNFEEFDARNVGNIFDSFNSFTYFGNFLPQEDFPFLTFSPTEEEKKHYAAYYDITVPKTFRGGKAS